ncbi:MAG TPA: hypothetical protein PLD25_20440 [Chloroflexota bacterium]|nr:hypothetical protein [Chloroflexota bacterium]
MNKWRVHMLGHAHQTVPVLKMQSHTYSAIGVYQCHWSARVEAEP